MISNPVLLEQASDIQCMNYIAIKMLKAINEQVLGL